MNSIRPALRSLLGTPASTLLVIATLALAIGANTAVFSVVQGVLLRPLGYPRDDRLVVLWATRGSDESELFRLSTADYRDVRDEIGAFGGQVALYRFSGSTFTGLDQPVRVRSLFVTPRLFQILGARPAAGQFFSEDDERPGGESQVLITHACWVRRFGGNPALVGSTVDIDSRPVTILGVTEEGFQYPPGSDEIEVFIPMTLTDAVLLDRNHRMFDAVARLAGDATLEAARDELSAMAARLAEEFPDTNAGWSIQPRPLREEMLGELGPNLWLLWGSVFLVLLIACANIANFQVARSMAAHREFAVRAALGARSRDLLERSLAESLILAGIGGLCSLPITFGGVSFLRSVMPEQILKVATVAIDPSVLLFTATLSMGSGILFGSLAAIRSLRPDIAALLKPAGSPDGSARERRVREFVVVFEVALAIVLLVCAGLMLRSFSNLSRVDPGYRSRGVVSVAVQLPASRHGRDEWRPFFEEARSRISRLPGVRAAGATSDLPMSSVGLGLELEFTVPDLALSSTARPNGDFRLVLPGYFEAMGMRVRQGRDFNSLDSTSDRAVGIVNQTLVERYFQGVDPIGRPIRVGPLQDIEIVGVVSDIRNEGLQSRYESEVYLPYGRIATAEMHLVVLSDLDTPAVARAVGDVLSEMDPLLAPSQVVALEDLLWESVAQPRFNTALLSGLALCAALLAMVGVYGIVTYVVSRRTQEIGVRMALGADSRTTLLMIVRQALSIVSLGAVIGILGAVGVSSFLGRWLFEIPPTDPVTYLAVLLVTLLTGFLAAWIPARRATRIDPISALRAQ